MSKKKSSGDMMIRDEFKSFIRKLDFHKGIYFMTSDKSSAALSEIEGLHPIYIKIPNQYNNFIFRRNEITIREHEISCVTENDRNEYIVKYSVPIGDVIYEFFTALGSFNLCWEKGEKEYSVMITGDCLGENLENWLKKNLIVKDKRQKELLLSQYKGIPLSNKRKIWKAVFESGANPTLF